VFHLVGDLGLFPGVVLVLRVVIAMRDPDGAAAHAGEPGRPCQTDHS
jgi:hypothetical protein